MFQIEPAVRNYDWGSPSAIPELLGEPTAQQPVAEQWYGAHAAAPSFAAAEYGGVALDSIIASDAAAALGDDVALRFGGILPYLLKLLAADRPLSLQVHPSREQARAGFLSEEAAGVALDAPTRNYKDLNHKPELVFALTEFRGLCGFRAPRRAAELLSSLDAPLAAELHSILHADPSAGGVRAAFTRLLDQASRPTAAEIQAVVDACQRRLADGSPSPRADRIVTMLADEYPGDVGVVASLLLNPVTLQPGEAMFVPAGGVHAYLHGLAVEIMACSDNVLRAGLTTKHIDIDQLLECVDYVAAPPVRIAPEVFHGATKVYYAPVDDFELSVTEVDDDESHPLPGRGPRILLCLAGEVTVYSRDDGTLTLARGQAAFVPASDGPLTLQGRGTMIQADVP